MSYTFKHSNDYDPGTWKGLQTPQGRKATATCPMCGNTCSLLDHEIDDSGKVTPSLVCPYDHCHFHEWVTLDGWEPAPAPAESS